MRQPLVFGKYLLLERISVGGMAEVFKAKSFGVEGFEKILAIKRILPSMAADAEFIEMFIDEAKIVGQLSHANICQLFELGQIGSSHYIAMEFVWGKDLLAILNRFRRQGEAMPIAMVAHIAGRMCEGLDYAHKRRDARGQPLSIVHRDVSPQNVLVSYEGEVKLIDFGIAKAATRSSRTQAGILKGKFGYMSPEQVRGLALDHRSDVFAVGTVIHELLTGERLFLADSDFTTLERVRNVAVDPPSKQRAEVPAALDRIVMKALARDRAERYQSAGELGEDLRAFAATSLTPLTAGELAAWMQQAFALELGRERAQLDEYRSLTLENAASAGPRLGTNEVERPPDFVPAEHETRPSGPPVVETDHPDDAANETRVDGPARGKGGQFGDDGPTEIFGEVETGQSLALATDERHDSSEHTTVEGQRRPAAPPAVPPARVTTRPLGGGAAPGAAARAPARASSPRSAGLPLVPGPATKLGLPTLPGVEGSLPLAPSSPPTPPPGSLPMAGGVPQLPPPLVPPARPAPPAPPPELIFQRTMTVTGIQAPPRWKVLARDAGLTVGIAVIVLGLVVSGRFVFGSGKPREAEAPSGVIVVASVDGAGGEVFVDGASRGHLQGSDPLLLEGLDVGEHDVLVRRGGAGECAQRVVLDGVRPAVVNCRAVPTDDEARLVLHLEPDDATVMVNAQEISAAAAREPLLLAPGATHTVTVSREGFVSQSLQVTLRSGEMQERTIALSPR